MEKQIKFSPDLVELIKSGKKTSTWRISDDKDLKEGDVVIFTKRPDFTPFAKARLTSVFEKKMGKLTEDDKKGHESYDSEKKMYQTYEKYYGVKVTPDTMVKIIRFEILEWK